MADLIAGDTTSLRFAFRKFGDKELIDLTGRTIVARYRINGSAEAEQAMTIHDAVSGLADVTFDAGDLVRGKISIRFKHTIGSTVSNSKKPLVLTIGENYG